MNAGVYLHIPFCRSRCTYCDFNTYVGMESLYAPYARALEREIRASTPIHGIAPSTIFFGGGTPSMTPPEVMEQALAPLELTQRVHAATEWTMEANPSSVDRSNLEGYQKLGVNRISMGVQALRDDLLARLGRVHSRDKALQSLEAIFESGLKNVSVDLLCGVPGQTLDILEEALAALTRFPITHLSCYLLTLPPHHRMYQDLPDEEEQGKHLQLIDQWMKAQGFNHYEISNFAKPGFEARHNLAYWKGHSYLGLGPSAHSFDRESATRWKNVSSLHLYADKLSKGVLPREQEEKLTSTQLELEKWMLALRLAEGFPATWLDSSLRQARAKLFVEKGYMEPHPAHPERMRLTARGFALSESIIDALS